MRIPISKLLYQLSFFTFLIGGAQAQSQEPITWRAVLSNNGEFSITLPEPLVVNQDKRWGRTTIVGGAGGVGFDLHFQKESVDEETLEKNALLNPKKGTWEAFNVAKSRIHIHTYKGAKIHKLLLIVATPKGTYTVRLFAPAADNPVLRSVLASIRLNDQPVIKDAAGEAPVASASGTAKSLPVSEPVLLALKRKQTEHITAEIVPGGFTPPEDETVYSRPGMVVSQPKAVYSEAGRNNNVQGSVRLYIPLKANGNIGTIIVVAGLPSGLTEQALRAASLIKFLPAEVDGKPADFAVLREYTFAIY
jgi:hypothetical protein